MDEEDIFRKLSFGLKYDTKRFHADAKRLHLVKSEEGEKKTNNINFFNGKQVSKTESPDSQELDQDLEKGETMQQMRKRNRIFVEGSDIPDLLTSFQQLTSVFGLDEELVQVLVRNMKFSRPTPIQMQAITAMMYRREILACAPTGSGKTLSFLIPLIAHMQGKSISSEGGHLKKGKKGIKALILSPTRELATQTLQVCKQLTCPVSDTETCETDAPKVKVQILDKATVKRFQAGGAKHGNKYDILISTPNRLIYLLQHDPPLLNLGQVEWLVVDESDKLFEEGGNDGFREQLGTIYSACTSPRIRRAMFSATFAFDVQQWCHLNMDSVIEINVGGKNTAVKSVNQKLLFTGSERGKLLALRDLFRQGFKPPALVFVQSKDRAKELFAELIYDGLNVDAIHADRTPLQRQNAVNCFRSGTTWILICTELLGRGIDFKGVNLVVNYDFPTSAVSYIHRIGRTGRAGRQGEAVTFFTEDDKPLLRSIANVIREAGCPVPDYMLQMKKMAKEEKKKAAKQEIHRLTIRTTPKDILEKGKKRKKRENSEQVEKKISKTSDKFENSAS